METKILDLLEEEINKHQNPNNIDQSSPYNRGYGEGALAEIIHLKHKIRNIMLSTSVG